MALERPAGRQDPLVFNARNDVGIAAIAVFRLSLGIKDLVSRCKDDRPRINFNNLVLLIEIDGTRPA